MNGEMMTMMMDTFMETFFKVTKFVQFYNKNTPLRHKNSYLETASLKKSHFELFFSDVFS